MLRGSSCLTLLPLLAIGAACHHSAADETEPAAPLQGTWAVGPYTTYGLGRDLKVVAQHDEPAVGDHLAISDSLMQPLAGTSQTIILRPYSYRRDGDTLRVVYFRTPPAVAQAITELTAHKLTLRWRRPLGTVVHYTTGDAYYELIEQHYSR